MDLELLAGVTSLALVVSVITWIATRDKVEREAPDSPQGADDQKP